VAFTDTKLLIGEAAKEQILKNPTNTVFNWKRLTGRRFSDPAVQTEIRNLPFRVEMGPGDRPLIVVSYLKEIKKYYPEEI
jgi:heat shock 70kDa protein 1/2/6/8